MPRATTAADDPPVVLRIAPTYVQRHLADHLGHAPDRPGGWLDPWLRPTTNATAAIAADLAAHVRHVTVGSPPAPVPVDVGAHPPDDAPRAGRHAWADHRPGHATPPPGVAWLDRAGDALDAAIGPVIATVAARHLAWYGTHPYARAYAGWARAVADVVARAADGPGIRDGSAANDHVRDTVKAATRRHAPHGWDDDYDVRYGSEVLGDAATALLAACAPHARRLVDVLAERTHVIGRLAAGRADPAHVLAALDQPDAPETLTALAAIAG